MSFIDSSPKIPYSKILAQFRVCLFVCPDWAREPGKPQSVEPAQFTLIRDCCVWGPEPHAYMMFSPWVSFSSALRLRGQIAFEREFFAGDKKDVDVHS